MISLEEEDLLLGLRLLIVENPNELYEYCIDHILNNPLRVPVRDNGKYKLIRFIIMNSINNEICCQNNPPTTTPVSFGLFLDTDRSCG